MLRYSDPLAFSTISLFFDTFVFTLPSNRHVEHTKQRKGTTEDHAGKEKKGRGEEKEDNSLEQMSTRREGRSCIYVTRIQSATNHFHIIYQASIRQELDSIYGEGI